jgi:hypothetical protein
MFAQFGAPAGEAAGDDASPAMCDQRNPLYVMPRANATYGEFKLSACIFGAAQRLVVLGGLGHFRIVVGQGSEAMEIEPPAI